MKLGSAGEAYFLHEEGEATAAHVTTASSKPDAIPSVGPLSTASLLSPASASPEVSDTEIESLRSSSELPVGAVDPMTGSISMIPQKDSRDEVHSLKSTALVPRLPFFSNQHSSSHLFISEWYRFAWPIRCICCRCPQRKAPSALYLCFPCVVEQPRWISSRCWISNIRYTIVRSRFARSVTTAVGLSLELGLGNPSEALQRRSCFRKY